MVHQVQQCLNVKTIQNFYLLPSQKRQNVSKALWIGLLEQKQPIPNALVYAFVESGIRSQRLPMLALIPFPPDGVYSSLKRVSSAELQVFLGWSIRYDQDLRRSALGVASLQHSQQVFPKFERYKSIQRINDLEFPFLTIY